MTLFEVRIVTVAPGDERPYDEAEWRDALVIVESGEIELRGAGGTCRRFDRGDTLWLAGVPLRALHNPGLEPAILVALSRRTVSSSPASSLPVAGSGR